MWLNFKSQLKETFNQVGIITDVTLNHVNWKFILLDVTLVFQLKMAGRLI